MIDSKRDRIVCGSYDHDRDYRATSSWMRGGDHCYATYATTVRSAVMGIADDIFRGGLICGSCGRYAEYPNVSMRSHTWTDDRQADGAHAAGLSDPFRAQRIPGCGRNQEARADSANLLAFGESVICSELLSHELAPIIDR